MALQHVLDTIGLLSRNDVSGLMVAELLKNSGVSDVEVTRVDGESASTDFVSCVLPGADPTAPTLGVIGRLGGLGARPGSIGVVSDADGAIAAVATALVLADLAAGGELMPGPVRIHTHICAAALTRPGRVVPMMRSPLPLLQMMEYEVHADMDAIVSIDATKATRYVNRRGVALTPITKQGWILPVPDGLLDIISWVSGELPSVMPLTTQDITPLDNGTAHLNSIMQPTTATASPVLGVAVTAASTIPGSATGVTSPTDLDVAVRFCVELAKRFGTGAMPFFDEDEFEVLTSSYGSLQHLNTMGDQ